MGCKVHGTRCAINIWAKYTNNENNNKTLVPQVKFRMIVVSFFLRDIHAGNKLSARKTLVRKLDREAIPDPSSIRLILHSYSRPFEVIEPWFMAL